MAKINFRDEWISKNILILAMQNGTFNENDYLGKLIAWGETAFCIKKERENRYYIEPPIVTGKQIGRAHV